MEGAVDMNHIVILYLYLVKRVTSVLRWPCKCLVEPLALPDTVPYSGSWLLLPFSERKLAEGKRSRAEPSQLREE